MSPSSVSFSPITVHAAVTSESPMSPPACEYSLEIKQAYIPLNRMPRWLLVFLAILGLSCATTGPDVEGEALLDFLKVLNDSNHQMTDWNSFLVSPCFSWSCVTCRDGHVISLSLGSKGFSGTLSPSVTRLKYLITLELQNNSLTGSDYIANLTSLQYLDLADNNFNGSIPSTWGQLSSLRTLLLRGNDLSGSISNSVENLSGLSELDLSSNHLTGTIPKHLFSVPIFNFSNTDLHCVSSLDQPCVSSSAIPASTTKSTLAVALRLASCGAFGILCLGVFFTYVYQYIQRHKNDVFVDVSVIFLLLWKHPSSHLFIFTVLIGITWMMLSCLESPTYCILLGKKPVRKVIFDQVKMKARFHLGN